MPERNPISRVLVAPLLAVFVTLGLHGSARSGRAQVATPEYSVRFSTLYGGTLRDQVRDIAVDDAGAAYVTGGTASVNLPAGGAGASGGLSPTHSGDWDVFVAKFDAGGALAWSGFLGGPGYDRAYAIAPAPDGALYVAGRAGAGFPVTPGVLQTSFRGGRAHPNDPYHEQDGFVCRLEGDGRVSACTYFGADDGRIVRDVTVGPGGEVYIAGGIAGGAYPQQIEAARLNGALGKDDVFVARLSADLSKVLWLRLLGGAEDDRTNASVGTDSAGNLYVASTTLSQNIATAGAYDTSYAGAADVFISKLAPDGKLSWTSYLGGTRPEDTETHELVVSPKGEPVVVATTRSSISEFAGASEATLRRYGSTGTRDVLAAKLSSDGSRLLALTVIGGSDDDSCEGTAVDPRGAIYCTGGSMSLDFPVTPAALEPLGGGRRALAVKLDADLALVYATYFSDGRGQNQGRAVATDRRGNFYFGGQTGSDAWPVSSGVQDRRAGLTDGFLVKLESAVSCADPDGDSSATASDGLFILASAVGPHVCDPCVCDTDGSGAVTASDALLELQYAVGGAVTPTCPACP